MSTKKKVALVAVVLVIVLLLIAALTGTTKSPEETPPRSETIPADAVKQTPAMDLYPPILNSTEWETPVPMPGPINTAGAEDSPFMMPDGKTFYFFFTPDVRVPVEKQLLDKVTGIWWAKNVNGTWTEPEKIILNDDVSLDGAEFVQGDTMWFGSVRAGNLGEIDVYTAELVDGRWTNVENAGTQLNVEYNIGEFTLSPDGQTLYFHSGEWNPANESMDIWMSQKTSAGWGQPVRVPNVNTNKDEGWPFVTPDGNELWFTGQSKLGQPGPAIFRSVKVGGVWGAPVEIVSRFAGEPTLDAAGNLYFVHHYYTDFAADGRMIEADIYVAYHNSSTRAIASSSAAEGHDDSGSGSIALITGAIAMPFIARAENRTWIPKGLSPDVLC